MSDKPTNEGSSNKKTYKIINYVTYGFILYSGTALILAVLTYLGVIGATIFSFIKWFLLTLAEYVEKATTPDGSNESKSKERTAFESILMFRIGGFAILFVALVLFNRLFLKKKIGE